MNQAQMQQPPQNTQQQVFQSANYGYNNSNALQIRLNTQPLLDMIEDFLRGHKISYDQDKATGIVKANKIQFGTSLANEEGIQHLLLKISSICNPQVVQGYFEQEEYDNYIERVHKNLAMLLVTNRYKWKVAKDNISGICDFIMELIEPFMSRLKDNTERESYNATIRSVETNTQQKKGFGINMPFRGN